MDVSGLGPRTRWFPNFGNIALYSLAVTELSQKETLP